jgi:hypothetical protein
MQIESISAPNESLRIQAPGLDPITVLLFDIGPGQGRMILECFGESLAGYWPSMGQMTIREFIRMCDADYLVGRMIPAGTNKRKVAYFRRIITAVKTALH